MNRYKGPDSITPTRYLQFSPLIPLVFLVCITHTYYIHFSITEWTTVVNTRNFYCQEMFESTDKGQSLSPFPRLTPRDDVPPRPFRNDKRTTSKVADLGPHTPRPQKDFDHVILYVSVQIPCSGLGDDKVPESFTRSDLWDSYTKISLMKSHTMHRETVG